MSQHVPLATSRNATGIPAARLAVWWAIISEIVIFGGLISLYLLYRLRFSDFWAQEAAHTKTIAGFINTVVLLTSSLFIVLAHKAAEEKNLQKTFKFIWLTIGGGLVFMVVKSYEYSSEILHGYTIFTNNFWSFYYTATGLHGLHVLIGIIIMAIISFDVRKGKHLNRVEIIGIYWHFVDIVWIFLFPLFYIAK